MKKGIIVGLIALTLLVGAFFIMLPQVLPQASEPDPELKFVGCNLSFADTIYVKYAVKGNDLSGVKLLIWTDPQTDYSYGSQNYVLNSIGTETVSGAQCLVFQYNKLAAKQMGDVIYARAFVEKQGNAYYSEVKKYSVLQYVYNKTGRTGTPSTNQKLIDLLEAMLEYGAKAQIYTNYKTNRLVSSNYYQVNVVGGMLPDGCDSGLYALGEVVTLTAPSTDLEGNAFSYWENDDGENIGTTATLDVTVISRNRTYTAVYGVETPVIPDPEYSTGLAYTDNGDGTCTITGIGTCTDLDVLIPPSIDGLTVSAIGVKAFENQSALTSIEIPDTVTTIGRRAFYGCTGLTEFTIPSSVNDIGTQIFYNADNIHTVYYNASYYPSTETENQFLNNAGIKKIVFGGVSIGSYAARKLGMINNVEEVVINGSATSINSYSFYGCIGLINVTIGGNISYMGDHAFSNCINLSDVIVNNSVTSIGENAFSDCT
ncbi:MAG: leucine-rich repeat domain-containing protein, partial [Clostridia bacterium]|nr:leucine-rich repeat domain-containing protein [Clostridia bacterium]